MIKFEVLPGQTLTWEQFLRRWSPFSIALDGFVSGGPRFDPEGPRVNFNHHEGVDRLATRATCAQVLMALRQGLFKRFRDNEGPRAYIGVNDCDEDVSTSVYLLKNHATCEQVVNPLLNRLVMMEDALDATAGAYPFPPDLPVLGQLAWVFEPYRQFRLSGGLAKNDAASYRSVIDDVCNRISKHVTGAPDSVPLDLRYERIGGGTGWAMVQEVGAQARTGMFADGIPAYVSVRSRGEGRWTYVVGKMSPFVPFDVAEILRVCQQIDGNPTDAWGGSNTVGGSPRVEGSRISPEYMCRIVDDVIRGLKAS